MSNQWVQEKINIHLLNYILRFKILIKVLIK